MKIRYQIIKITPYFLSNFQPLRCVATTRKITVEKREMVEYSSPGEERGRTVVSVEQGGGGGRGRVG